MPEAMLKRALAAGIRQPADLARRSGVSEQALWIQLVDLKLADQLRSDEA